MSAARRRQLVDREHRSLSLVRRCALLGVSRSSLYYRPRAAWAEDLSLIEEIDRQYLETPFFWSRRMKAWLERRGMPVSRRRVQRLMRAMGFRAIYRRPGTSRRAPEHPVYPYLLRSVRITRPNQAWAADITYLPMARGFLYLVAVMDWHSRYVLAWMLSNTLEVSFFGYYRPPFFAFIDPPSGCRDLDFYQVSVEGSMISFAADQLPMGRQFLSVAGPLDDDLVAGVGQAVQRTVSKDGVVEEAEPLFHRAVAGDGEAGSSMPADDQLV